MNGEVFEYKELTYKGKAIFGKLEMGDFKRIEKYFQENEACFMFIDKGSFVLRTPERTIQFKSGDGLLAKCSNYFFENNLEHTIPVNRTVLIAAYFYPDIIKELFSEDFSKLTYQTNYDANKIKIDKLLLNFKDNINFLLDNPELADDSLILTKLKEFIILLAKTDKAPSVLEFVSSLFKPYEYDFKTTIESNILSSLSLNEFATLCGMSLATFKRKFNTYYNESPKKYILNKKLEKAKQLLTIKENRIVDIAFDCGFESINTFNRNFKSYFGKSPSEIRK